MSWPIAIMVKHARQAYQPMQVERVRLEWRLFCASYATVYRKDEVAHHREATAQFA